MKKRVHLKNIKAFTLMELMIAVVIISIFATFAIPNYRKAVLKARERKARLILTTIHGANEIYRARIGSYLPGAGLNLTNLSVALQMTLTDTDMTYSYTRSAPLAYTTTAAWTGPGAFTARVNQNAVTAANPCCSAGTCPSLPAC